MLSASFALIFSMSSPAEFHRANLTERLSKVSIVQHQDPMHSCRIALLVGRIHICIGLIRREHFTFQVR